MKHVGLPALVVVCATIVLPRLVAAQAEPAIQVPIPKSAAEVPGPVPGNTVTNAYVQLVGRMAYVWGYPLVNAHNRRAAFALAPEPGLLGGALPIAPDKNTSTTPCFFSRAEKTWCIGYLNC